MRILQMGPYPPPHGGVQTNLVAIRRFLEARQIPCAVINLTRFRRPDAEGVYYPKTALQVCRLLARLPYDIVHLHIGGKLTRRLLGLAWLCASLPGKRAVLTFHSGGYPDSGAGRSASPRTIRGFIMRRFDRIIAVNEQIAELFRRLGVPPDRVRLIPPHALSVAPAPSLPEPWSGFVTGHSPVLITVGLLEPEYNLATQIAVLGDVRRHFPNAGLLIIGSGSLEGELRRAIAGQPHRAHVMLAGDVPHSITLRAIAASDLLLRTTLYDGDSIAVREALHLGTPVIATENGQRPSGVKLIPKPDRVVLQAAIERCLSLPTCRVPLQVGSGEENLQAILDLYGELLDSDIPGPCIAPARPGDLEQSVAERPRAPTVVRGSRLSRRLRR
jgi:glycosyltransferase involved in cell wall biosynthesis